jgi:hypothetical protein
MTAQTDEQDKEAKMKRVFGIAVVATLIAVPGFAQKVSIDYAHDFDFDSVTTFQYVDTPDSNITDNPMMADRVASMIRKEMREGGLTEVKENPDLFITYHFTSQEQRSFSTTSMGYGGYGDYWGGWGGWGGGGMGTSTTTEHVYEVGTLIIDAYDSKEKKMVWRGSGTVTVKAKPEKQVKQVEKILTKLGNRWDKILEGRGK